MKNPYYPYTPEWFNHTTLDCKDAKYTENADTYGRFKKLMLLLSGIFGVLCIVIILKTNFSWLQTCASAFLGGVLSMLVWMITIKPQDNMNRELNVIDARIATIDTIIHYLHGPIYIIGDGTVTPVYPDNADVNFRITHMIQAAIMLNAEKTIYSDELKLKWFDDNECTLQQFIDQATHLLNDSQKLQVTEEKAIQIVTWNMHWLEQNLLYLKEKLAKRKVYISCGNAPIPNDKLANYRRKADRFDMIFNHKQWEARQEAAKNGSK